ncbi:nucleotidyltransferase family protein [Serratia sp. NPDC078593]|uniref:nucleotidyltransferase family protein n=1 Tax=unclassified Serratia (in: enterobacteria) TaxID=2647522 RepID=UPI0037D495CE
MESDEVLTAFLFDSQRALALSRKLSEEQWQICLHAAVEHKILPRAVAFYRRVSEQPLAPNFAAILDAHQRERHSWLAACRALQFDDGEMRAMLMKGFGHEMLYPERSERFAKDLDIVVQDLDAFCRFARQLFQRGFSLPFLARLYLHPTQGSWCGLGRFIFDRGLEDGGVELHIGQFAIDSHHVLDWQAIASHACECHFAGIPLIVPDTVMKLKVFFMELATRPACMLRDLYDGHCLFAVLEPSQEAALRVQLGDAGLADQVDKLLAAFKRYRLTPPEVLSRLADTLRVSARPQPQPVTWQQRWRHWLDSACEKEGWRLHVLSLLDRAWFTNLALRRGMTINALLIDDTPAEMKLTRQRHYLLLTTPAGTFLLGVCGLFSDEEVEQLQAALRQKMPPAERLVEEKRDA